MTLARSDPLEDKLGEATAWVRAGVDAEVGRGDELAGIAAGRVSPRVVGEFTYSPGPREGQWFELLPRFELRAGWARAQGPRPTHPSRRSEPLRRAARGCGLGRVAGREVCCRPRGLCPPHVLVRGGGCGPEKGSRITSKEIHLYALCNGDDGMVSLGCHHGTAAVSDQSTSASR